MAALILSGLILLSSLVIPLPIAEETAPLDDSSGASIISTSRAAEPEVPPFSTEAQALIVADAEAENEEDPAIVSYQTDKRWSIASLTKLMTAIVYLEENPDLNRVITLSKEDMVGGAALKVPVGTKFHARDLLHASLMASANNATVALTRGTNLSAAEFIAKMNEKAQELGAQDTIFVEPSGLNPENRSTASDFAKIAAYAFDNSVISAVNTTSQYNLRPLNHVAFTIGNTDKLLKEQLGFNLIGGKTGFTYGSDYNFAAKVQVDDKEMVVVVFGDKTFDGAFETTKLLVAEALRKTTH